VRVSDVVWERQVLADARGRGPVARDVERDRDARVVARRRCHLHRARSMISSGPHEPGPSCICIHVRVHVHVRVGWIEPAQTLMR
jgi:hypothetical protein